MFEGFSPETVDFLWGIRMNNNREWFTANKQNYVNYLYEPMKALGKELFEPFMDLPGNLLTISSRLQSFPASGSFPVSQFFASGGQKYWSFSFSISPSNEYSGLISFRMRKDPGWISLQSKGLSRVFSNTTVQKHQFFGAQLSSQSNSHIHT